MRITNDKSLQKLHALTLMYTWKRLVSSPMTVTKLLIYFRFISTYSVDKCKYVFFNLNKRIAVIIHFTKLCTHSNSSYFFNYVRNISRRFFSVLFFFPLFYLFFKLSVHENFFKRIKARRIRWNSST